MPVEGVGDKNLEKFNKMHTYYRDVVCPAMVVSGMFEEQYRMNDSAHQCMKKYGIVLLKDIIKIDDDMQNTLLKKLMSFKLTRGMFTELDNNAKLNPDEPNRYVSYLFYFLSILPIHIITLLSETILITQVAYY